MSELFATDSVYRVLARKYRPASFDALIGQDAMVTTLANAIARDQIAHAFLLTGVRGVGKTSTARIIAKALNCIGTDGSGGPTISPCGVCDFCVSISEGRNMDVIEMDAASHTGVDDMRAVIEAARLQAFAARYKIYIIDEVHMLSKSAFNALLKTLEEPPAHVKFLLATTEVQKLPITVLSRCQRFDLRRIPADVLAGHFAGIVAAENCTAEPEALALIARAAEGSVRDGLSILDQAIAHGSGAIEAQAVRDMLGLSDRGAVRDLMGLLLAGEGKAALEALRRQYDHGAGPDMVVQELLELVHTITRAKVADAVDPTLGEAERAAVADWASRLPLPQLHRLWQLLLKGLAEVQSAPVPIQAAEMALLRIVHASSLPDPADLVRRLQSAEGQGPAPRAESPREPTPRQPEMAEARHEPEPPVPHPSSPPPPEAVAAPDDFSALVRLFADRGEHMLAHQLHDDARLVRYAPPLIELAPSRARPEVAQRVMACLKEWTGERWTVTVSDAPANPTLREAEEAVAALERAAVLADPSVAALIAAFPGAELIDYQPPELTPESDQRRA